VARIVQDDDVGVGEEALSRLERDQLEAVDVDEAAVGELQARGSPTVPGNAIVWNGEASVQPSFGGRRRCSRGSPRRPVRAARPR
jgi:hypothetical protein